MNCPKCGSENNKVLEKRDNDEDRTIRRRRECTDCFYRFTTYERVEIPIIIISKKDGEKEPFSREKAMKGVLRAIEKRPVDMVQVDELMNNLEAKLKGKGDEEIPSTFIGDYIIEKLKDIDQVAYIRFASVFKAFKNINSFEKELEELRSKPELQRS